MDVLHIISQHGDGDSRNMWGGTDACMKLNEIDATMCNCLKFTIESIVRNGDVTSIMDFRSSHEANPTIQAANTNAGSWQPTKTWNPPNCAMDLFAANQGSQVSIHPIQIPRSKPARPYALHQRPVAAKVLQIQKCKNIQKTYKNTQKHPKNIRKLHPSILAIEKLTCSVPNSQNSIAFVAASPVLAST